MSRGNQKRRSANASGKRAPGASGANPAQSAGQQATGQTTSQAPSQAASTRPAARPAPARSGGRRRRSRINWIWVIAAIGGAALIGAVIFNIVREVQVIAGVQTYGPFPANVHVNEEVTYAQTPPTGGEHRATWQNCGIYNAPVVDELAVHSMEHGAVWLTYRPDLPADQVERLKGLVRGRSYTLLSPYPDLPAPVVASGWGVQLTAESADDGRLSQFVSKYRQGSQTPEQGATCVGGVGSPDE